MTDSNSLVETMAHSLSTNEILIATKQSVSKCNTLDELANVCLNAFKLAMAKKQALIEEDKALDFSNLDF